MTDRAARLQKRTAKRVAHRIFGSTGSRVFETAEFFRNDKGPTDHICFRPLESAIG